jgi:hypothetical protein
VVSLVAEVRSLGGHFLKFEDAAYGTNDDKSGHGGCWVDIGDTLAREKVSHSLRDQINHQSRRKAKIVQRQQQVKFQQQQWQQGQEQKLQARQSSCSLIPGIPKFSSSGFSNINNSFQQPGAAVLPQFTRQQQQQQQQQQAHSLEAAATSIPPLLPSGSTNINRFKHPAQVLPRQQQAQSLGAMMIHQPLLPSAATTTAATRAASSISDPGRVMDRHSPSFVPTDESSPVSIFDI